MSQALSSQRSWIARISVLAMLASLMAFGAAPAGAAIDTSDACPSTITAAGFTDLAGVPAAAVDAINCIADYGISTGTTATTFDPFAEVARWQMALFITRQATAHGLGSALPAGTDQGFTDLGGVPAAAVTSINQIAELGISTGTSATTFDPFATVERWQMALFLQRLIVIAVSDNSPAVTLPDGSDQGFTDLAGVPAAAVTAINTIAQLDVADGTTATTFDPFAAVERWAMALFLARTLAADGITPAPSIALGETDAPQLIDVVLDASDSDDTRLLFVFDEDVSIVDETGFLLVDPTGTIYEPQTDTVDKGADNEVEAIFANDIVDVATIAAVERGAVENIDGDEGPAGFVGYNSFTVDGFDLPGVDVDPGEAGDNDAPELVSVDASSFDDDDDTIEVEFDQDMDDATITEGSFLFVEEGGAVWFGVTGSASTDDEIVTIELNSQADGLGDTPDDSDAEDLVRLFLEPGAANEGVDSPPHSVDISLNGENDDTPSLESVDVDTVDKEITFTFNRSVVDQTYDTNTFVLVAVDDDGSVSILNPSSSDDLDRDSSRVIIWDTDDNGVVETAMASMIVYVGIWDADGDGDTSLVDFATGGELEVGHFVNFSYSFSAGQAAAPLPINGSGDVTGLGNDYEIDVTWSQDMDTATFNEPDVWLFELGGDSLDPDVDDIDPTDEVVTYTVLDGADGFDELDDGDVGVISFDQGHAENAWGYQSPPGSVGCGC